MSVCVLSHEELAELGLVLLAAHYDPLRVAEDLVAIWRPTVLAFLDTYGYAQTYRRPLERSEENRAWAEGVYDRTDAAAVRRAIVVAARAKGSPLPAVDGAETWEEHAREFGKEIWFDAGWRTADAQKGREHLWSLVTNTESDRQDARYDGPAEREIQHDMMHKILCVHTMAEARQERKSA